MLGVLEVSCLVHGAVVGVVAVTVAVAVVVVAVVAAAVVVVVVAICLRCCRCWVLATKMALVPMMKRLIAVDILPF